jgi:hypothetical protein
MKINFDLKSKYPNVKFCYNNKCIIIRYWGRLKFDKVVFYDSEQKNSYSEKEVILLLQKALTHKDDGEIGSLITAQGEIRTANFFSWFETFKKK